MIRITQREDGSFIVEGDAQSCQTAKDILISQYKDTIELVRPKSKVSAMQLRREALGMSKSRLSELTGMCAPFLNDIEQGRRKASLQTQVKIAGALDCLPGDIFPYVGDNCTARWSGREKRKHKDDGPLRKLRKVRKLYMAEVAKIIGLEYYAYVAIEVSNRCENEEICLKFQELYGVTLAELGLCENCRRMRNG